MTNGPEKKPRNVDQELPRRKGESIESTVGNERGNERDRNAPVSEEETYEREPRNQRPRSWRDVND
jgi:hypothetical protein